MRQRFTDTVRRSASGAVDTQCYMNAARRERARLLRGWMAERSAVVRRFLKHGGVCRLLNRLSDRELRDIGLCRSEFDAVADGSYFVDTSRHGGARGRHE